MLSLLPPRTESFLSPEHSTAPTPFMSAPSSPDWKLDLPESKSQELFVFQTEWKGFMSSSQELKVRRRSEHHLTNSSSSMTNSDFEFDAGVSDVADPPVSPKLSYSDRPLSPMFLYSDFWTDEQVYTKEVPVISPVPHRSAPSQSMRQLLATELDDDASSCASYPQSPRSQRGDEQTDRRSVRHIFGETGEMKSSGARNEQKKKSLPDHMRIFQHSPRTGRVHHADEDQYPSARRSDPPLSLSHSSSEEEKHTTFKHDKADSTQQHKRWALKDLLNMSKRSSHNESKTQKVQTLTLRPSKSTPTSPLGARPRSPLRSSRPMSPHEAHYKNQKAQWDEMKKKTTLPYKQGLLGCLGGALFSEMAVL